MVRRMDQGTYHEEGWLYDLGEARTPLITLILAILCFAVTVVLDQHPSHGLGYGRGMVATATGAGEGLFTLLTLVVSLLSAGVGLYVASQNHHRVRLLARVFAGLSMANPGGFVAFAVAVS